MNDSCWLNDQVLTSVSNLKFSLTNIVKEDDISLNVRHEIISTLNAKLTEDTAEADVLIKNSEEDEQGFAIKKVNQKWIIKAGKNSNLLRGLYYFIIHYYLKDLEDNVVQKPDQEIRMIDHWDNFDGSIERGYAGNSIFFENNKFTYDFSRIEEYARLMASIGINYIAINNVNVHMKETFFISEAGLKKVKLIADIFKRFGIKTLLSINFASPIRFGDLDTSDPLDEKVKQWWQERAKLVYKIIPDFGGFLVKADSEGEPGPYSYGRNHAQGANMLAAAVKPYQGIIIWRAFVYNSQQDWRDRTIDRAKAAYDNFAQLDGQFADNAVLQIKFGPIDFQTREPIQPLFNAMRKTNQIIEFQITQEYTGHQIDTNYLLPQWTRALKFQFYRDEQPVQLCNLPNLNAVDSRYSGIAAVTNVGNDKNWTGNKLAQSNLYGFGRLAWNNHLTSDEILDEWVKLTIQDESAVKITKSILATSNQTYEDYTAPLAVGFMVNPSQHYGPSPDGYEFDRWGTYHFADREGVGVDRTLATGTGYTRQYDDHNFNVFEHLETCPDELLLFFHHVPYTHVLHSGKTVIQHIYDTHFSGVVQVEDYVSKWKQVEGKVSEEFFENVSNRLDLQLKNAINWRDQINTFFYRMSGIADENGRKIFH